MSSEEYLASKKQWWWAFEILLVGINKLQRWTLYDPVAIWQKTLIKSILKDGPHQSLLEVNIIAIEVDMILSNFFKRPNLILICLHMVDYLEISDHSLR